MTLFARLGERVCKLLGAGSREKRSGAPLGSRAGLAELLFDPGDVAGAFGVQVAHISVRIPVVAAQLLMEALNAKPRRPLPPSYIVLTARARFVGAATGRSCSRSSHQMKTLSVEELRMPGLSDVSAPSLWWRAD